MTPHERWILEAACTLRQPLHALTSDRLEEWFNRPHHGLAPTAVADVLRRLLLQELIVLSPGDGEVLRDNEEELRRLVDLDYRGPLFKTT
jgi:hypothetical protein